MLPVAVSPSFSDGNAVRYVLPVLWMTSRFYIIGHMWCTARNTARDVSQWEATQTDGRSFSARLLPAQWHP